MPIVAESSVVVDVEFEISDRLDMVISSQASSMALKEQYLSCCDLLKPLTL